MSKTLRAFKKICKNLNSYEFTDEYKKNKKLIETALKKYDYIDENKVYLVEKEKYIQDQKKLKALEIIKEKDVDVSWFRECLSCGKPLEVYNDRYNIIRGCDGKDYRFMMLTQEEFDLLKEILK